MLVPLEVIRQGKPKVFDLTYYTECLTVEYIVVSNDVGRFLVGDTKDLAFIRMEFHLPGLLPHCKKVQVEP